MSGVFIYHLVEVADTSPERSCPKCNRGRSQPHLHTPPSLHFGFVLLGVACRHLLQILLSLFHSSESSSLSHTHLSVLKVQLNAWKGRPQRWHPSAMALLLPASSASRHSLSVLLNPRVNDLPESCNNTIQAPFTVMSHSAHLQSSLISTES